MLQNEIYSMICMICRQHIPMSREGHGSHVHAHFVTDSPKEVYLPATQDLECDEARFRLYYSDQWNLCVNLLKPDEQHSHPSLPECWDELLCLIVVVISPLIRLSDNQNQWIWIHVVIMSHQHLKLADLRFFRLIIDRSSAMTYQQDDDCLICTWKDPKP